VRREIHLNTWRYHQLLDDQRRIVLRLRDRILHTDAALRSFEERCPERVRDVRAGRPADVLVRVARDVALWHLDREWADHLGQVADLCEGIHLRALGRGMNPLDEFNRELIRLFEPLLGRAAGNSEETFRKIRVTASGADLDAEGMSRPTATWAHLVQDNPLGSDIDRALRRVGRLLRDRRGNR
jgi:preprotein translocase subunit SecA